MTGAVAGAISSAVYGGNWGKNMLEGAKGGAIGAGIGMAVKSLLNSFKLAGQNLKFNSGGPHEAHITMTTILRTPITKKFLFLTIADYEAKTTSFWADEYTDILDSWRSIPSDRQISFFEYTGHGYDNGWGLAFGTTGTTGDPGLTTVDLMTNAGLIQRVFCARATIELQACNTAFGKASFAETFHNILPDADIYAYVGSPILFESPNLPLRISGEVIPLPWSMKVRYGPPEPERNKFYPKW